MYPIRLIPEQNMPIRKYVKSFITLHHQKIVNPFYHYLARKDTFLRLPPEQT